MHKFCTLGILYVFSHLLHFLIKNHTISTLVNGSNEVNISIFKLHFIHIWHAKTANYLSHDSSGFLCWPNTGILKALGGPLNVVQMSYNFTNSLIVPKRHISGGETPKIKKKIFFKHFWDTLLSV